MHNLYSSNRKRSYKKYILHIQFIDSARFMASSLSNLVNLSEGIHRINVNMDMMIKNVKRGIKYKYCDCFVEYTNFKDDLIEYKCSCGNKNYQQKFEKLKERFYTYKYSNQDNNKFILLL